MKYFLTPLLLVLIGFVATAQNYNAAESQFLTDQKAMLSLHPDCDCRTLPPWTLIVGPLANLRIKSYKSKMGRCKLPTAGDITYSIDGAIDLLNKVTSNGYDGFRVYFGIYPSKQQKKAGDSACDKVPTGLDNTWTLIFVPTKDDGWYHKSKLVRYRRHVDDLNNCMIIGDKSAEQISAKDASAWINKAAIVIDSVERHRKKTLPLFHETRNLWYNNKYVVDNCFNNGLLQVLKCKKCLGTKHVYAKFGAYWFNRYWNQITLVFQVDDGPKKAFLTLNSADRSMQARNNFKKCFPRAKNTATDDDSGGSDTGKPCPPPSPCGTDVGSSLPNQ